MTFPQESDIELINEKYWNWRETGITAHELTPQEALAEAFKNDLIKEAYQIIGQGKEAFVWWGKDNLNRSVAVKSYKIFRTSNRNIIHNTYRTSPYVMITCLAKLEFYKTLDLYELGLPVPQPYKWKGYSFSMELIGTEEGPAPLLRECNKDSFDDPSDVLEICIDILKDMFQQHYVHGDFSEHNLIIHNDNLFAIDFLQSKKFALKDAVSRCSPLIPLTRAYRILQNDVKAILTYFNRCFRLKTESQEVLDYIVGEIGVKIKKELELSSERKN
ncbi:MAG: RIO1 family regulatory kinase/ATPase [Candidatus Thorarchaeota archaeon]